MLTVEKLRQNPAISALTEAQLNTIAEMSRNDENAVIGVRIGELHGQYDSDIYGITGIKKKDSEKSYDYNKRVLTAYKAELENFKVTENELETAKTKIAELTKKLADNAADKTLGQQLKDAKNQVAQLQSTLSTQETELKAMEAEYKSKLQNLQVDYAFREAVANLKFKDNISEAIKRVVLDSAKAEVLKKGTPEFITASDGVKTLAFRDSEGNILNNPKNNLNPYSFKELILETSLKDIIEAGYNQAGGGTTGKIDKHDKGVNSMLDLAGIKTQVEADKVIEQYLLSNGLTRDSQEFATQLSDIRTENNIGNLPIR